MIELICACGKRETFNLKEEALLYGWVFVIIDGLWKEKVEMYFCKKCGNKHDIKKEITKRAMEE